MSLRVRYTALTLATFTTLALALLVGFNVQDSQALPQCICPQSELAYQTTTPTWGMGASCQAAIDNGVANSTPEAHQICGTDGVCAIDPNPIIVTPCRFEGGMWKVDVQIRFKCFICLDTRDP